MKKLFIAIAIVAISATTVMAQSVNREAKREARQTAEIAQIKAALASQDFSFTPYTFTAAFQNPIQLQSGPMKYVEVYPGELSMMLPFTVGTPNPLPTIRNLTLVNVPYTYSIKTLDNDHYVVMMRLTNVSNSNVGPNMALQNINLTLHFYVAAATGQTTLTITPDFAPSSSYWGTVFAN